VSVPAALAAVLVVGVMTYSARAVPILFLADRTLPAPVMRALRYIGPAVLSALTVTLLAGGEGTSGVEAIEVVALVAAVVVTVLTRNLLAALVAGMSVLWLLIWLT
jgi:branched-subunit amino acid transport protein